MQQTPEKAVFISHASQDKAKAQEICARLEGMGIPCWIAPRDIPPGGNYAEEIMQGIRACRGMLVVMSARANDSVHVRNEVERAVSLRKQLFPVFIEDIPPSSALEFFLGSSQWTPLWQKPQEEKYEKLAGAIRTLTGAPAPAPTPTTPPRSWKPAAAAAALVLAIAAGVTYWLMRPETPRPPGARNGQISKKEPGAAARTSATALPRYKALVIGINRYQAHRGQGWEPLRTAHADAEAVGDILEQEYGFEVTRLFDEQATRAGMMGALDLAASLEADDALLIYYAGHGHFDEKNNRGFWIPVDARKQEGDRLPTEDWIWNSTLTDILGASKAQHILVLADSCYGGSLFRGGTPPDWGRDKFWYQRALAKPSRFLISSGDVEPVMDGAGQHSVFAQQVISFLRAPEKEVFSATELSQAIRESVGRLTGQMVRAEPLPVAAHAGGEFIFARLSAEEALTTAPAAEVVAEKVSVAELPPPPAKERLRNALIMAGQGATGTAQQVVANVMAGSSDQAVARAVASYLSREEQERRVAKTRELISKLEARKSETGPATVDDGQARPRILACLGPTDRRPQPDEATALLYRIALRAELESSGRVQVVEREALEQILQEMELGSSELADNRARLTVGRLLPASLLLLGDLLPKPPGEIVHVRLVDTETSGSLGSFSAASNHETPFDQACRELAAGVVEKAVSARPLTARVLRGENGQLTAAAGTFHGAVQGTRFSLVERMPVEAGAASDFREQVLGEATVEQAGELTCDLNPTWIAQAAPEDYSRLWVKESAVSPAE